MVFVERDREKTECGGVSGRAWHPFGTFHSVYRIVHPYVLADNRHYTFYIWRKVLTAVAWQKYVYVPLYYACGRLLVYIMAVQWRRPAAVCWMWFTCSAAVLIPSVLLEPRYFILPIVLYRLMWSSQPMRPTSPSLATSAWAGIQLLSYLALDAWLIGMFLEAPFVDASGNVGRFLW